MRRVRMEGLKQAGPAHRSGSDRTISSFTVSESRAPVEKSNDCIFDVQEFIQHGFAALAAETALAASVKRCLADARWVLIPTISERIARPKAVSLVILARDAHTRRAPCGLMPFAAQSECWPEAALLQRLGEIAIRSTPTRRIRPLRRAFAANSSEGARIGRGEYGS